MIRGVAKRRFALEYESVQRHRIVHTHGQASAPATIHDLFGNFFFIFTFWDRIWTSRRITYAFNTL
jgi:hypothetical protein